MKNSPSSSNNLVTILLGILLVGSLLVLLFYAYLFWFQKPAAVVSSVPAVSSPQLMDVLVSVTSIESGTALEPTMFRKESVPTTQLAPNTLTDFDQVRGAYAASFIADRQPLSADFITLKPPVNQIQATIPEGFRAVSMSVDVTTSVEGWARPGAKVDVLLASTLNSRPAITVIVQNAKVLSAGRSTSGDGGQPVASTVTIMVTVDEAAKIQLASSSGVLSLALRGDEDPVESPENSTVTIDSVIGVVPAQTPLAIPSEGKVKVGGRQFLVVNGKLVPDTTLADK